MFESFLNDMASQIAAGVRSAGGAKQTETEFGNASPAGSGGAMDQAPGEAGGYGYDTPAGGDNPASDWPIGSGANAQPPVAPPNTAIQLSVPSAAAPSRPEAASQMPEAPGLIAGANPALPRAPQLVNLGKPKVVVNGQYV